jgi:hypothetical protein
LICRSWNGADIQEAVNQILPLPNQSIHPPTPAHASPSPGQLAVYPKTREVKVFWHPEALMVESSFGKSQLGKEDLWNYTQWELYAMHMVRVMSMACSGV